MAVQAKTGEAEESGQPSCSEVFHEVKMKGTRPDSDPRGRDSGEYAPVLRLLGTPKGERRLVQWCDRPAALTPKCFKFLAKLAVSKATQPERWVTRDELERGENQARYLYRLKGEIESQCGDLPALWENNRRGGYRLTLPPDRIVVSWQTLEAFDDYDLVAWVRAFRPLQVRPLEVRPGQVAAVQPAL